MSDMGPIEYFVCGGFGGICTVLVGHPLDTIKVSEHLNYKANASNQQLNLYLYVKSTPKTAFC